MNRFFTSDLHLGHKFAAEQRGFNSIEEHDTAIIESFLDLPRRSKLWVLGDVAFSKKSLKFLTMIPCKTKILLMGNHDTYHASEYLEFFDDIIGPIKYHNFWLSHHPIHPQEMYRCEANIHGHIHKNAGTPEIPYPYINVNWDFHQGAINFDEIEAMIPYETCQTCDTNKAQEAHECPITTNLCNCCESCTKDCPELI